MKDSPSKQRRPEPSARGNFRRSPVVQLFGYAFERQLTGTLEIASPDGKTAEVVLADGLIGKVRTSENVMTLGRVLVESGTVAQPIVDHHVAKTAGLLGDSLVSGGEITDAQLSQALCLQMARKAAYVCSFPADSSFQFLRDFNALHNYGGHFLSLIHPFLTAWFASGEYPSAEHIQATLGNLGAHKIRVPPPLPSMQITTHVPDLNKLFDVVRGRVFTLAELANSGIVPGNVAQRFIYCCTLTRHLEFPEVPATNAVPPPLQSRSHTVTGMVSSLGMGPRPGDPGTTTGVMAAIKVVSPAGPPSSQALPELEKDLPREVVTSPRPTHTSTTHPLRRNSSTTMSAVVPPRDRPSSPPTRSDNFADLDPPDTAELSLELDTRRGPGSPARMLHDSGASASPGTGTQRRWETTTGMAKASGMETANSRTIPRSDDDDGPSRVDPRNLTPLEQAELALRKRDYARAEAICRKALDAEPQQANFLAMLAWVDIQRPEHQTRPHAMEAIATLDRAISFNDRCADAFYYRGMIFKKLQDFGRALRDIRHAAELNPEHAGALRELRELQRAR